ncbi:olfactory receptor 51E1-like [Bufo gargarizans]|uniref:olfactory receptor 51E1-like n=1 Tax=Bufo gargarizans TaxID=30331 RepID=UPI001CF20494|nr:olfactory receptor 51E1-like [Bufo gargarizans]
MESELKLKLAGRPAVVHQELSPMHEEHNLYASSLFMEAELEGQKFFKRHFRHMMEPGDGSVIRLTAANNREMDIRGIVWMRVRMFGQDVGNKGIVLVDHPSWKEMDMTLGDMNSSQASGSIPPEFLLVGLSWLEGKKLPASLLFLLMYLVVIFSNCTIMALVKTDKKLQKPMHIFISLLALVDLSVSTSVIPKVLTILWFDSNTITSAGCLTQIYVLYSMLSLQSSLFALMSFDRYVAICHPLRHSTIMSRSFMIISVAFIVSRTSVFIIPLPVITARLTFCKVNIIYHSYCEYVELLKLSCGDLQSCFIHMAILICIFPGGDNSLMIFSYVQILRVVYMLKSPQARWKSLSTCTSHAILLSLFYMSSCLPLYLFLFYPNSPLYVKTITATISFLLLPMINPIVYGARSKEIQDGLRRVYWRTLLS